MDQWAGAYKCTCRNTVRNITVRGVRLGPHIEACCTGCDGFNTGRIWAVIGMELAAHVIDRAVHGRTDHTTDPVQVGRARGVLLKSWIHLQVLDSASKQADGQRDQTNSMHGLKLFTTIVRPLSVPRTRFNDACLRANAASCFRFHTRGYRAFTASRCC